MTYFNGPQGTQQTGGPAAGGFPQASGPQQTGYGQSAPGYTGGPAGGYGAPFTQPGYTGMNPPGYTTGSMPQGGYPPMPGYTGGQGMPAGPMQPQQGEEEPQGFDYVPKTRGPRRRVAWWHWAVVAAAALGVAIFAYISFRPERATTAVVRTASLGEQYSGDAIVVRDEAVYDAEGVTQVEYVADEGQWVRYNTEICRIYISGYSNTAVTSLQDARDAIRTYQRTLLTSETTVEGQRYAAESNVLQSVRQIRDIMGGAPGNLSNQEEMLTAAVRDRQSYIRNRYSSDQRLTRLLEDANVAEQKIDSYTRRAKAIEECIVSFYVDGFEYGLTMNNYNTFDPAQVRSMMNGQKPDLTASQRGRTAIYRTIRDNPWAVLMLADDQTWNPVEGQEFRMKLETFSDDQVVVARVESFRRTGGELLVILVVDSGVSDVLDLRQSRVELYSENTALIVPSRAIFVQDEMEGVVVRSGTADLFVPVTIIRRSGDDVYISPVTEGFLFEGLTVRLF